MNVLVGTAVTQRNAIMNGKWSRLVRNLSAGAAMTLVGAGAAFGQTVVYMEDFESAPFNFTSGHGYFPAPKSAYGSSSPLYEVKTYTVDTDPNSWHPAWASYGDHTTGVGKMMIVNAAEGGQEWNCAVKVFESPSIAVTPNKTYEFSYWVALSHPLSPPLLQASINGVALSPSFDAGAPPLPLGDWQNVKYTWNSAAATTASLSLCDARTTTFGDDYALDDIALTTNENAGQWCSPGYWRQPQHLDSWAATTLEPTDLYSWVVGANPSVKRRANGCGDPKRVPDSPTLMQVLTYPQCYGGEAANLVADKLSANHPQINWVGTRVQNACPLN